VHAVTRDLDPTYYGEPKWSPDGAWLAVQDESRYSAPSIAVVRSDGRDLTEIRTASDSSAEALDAAWSPEGTRLALGGNDGLFLVERDVWKAKPLRAGGRFPSWSPDGGRILFSYSNGLAIVSVDSGAVTRLPAPAARAAWSPDGTRIAYANRCRVGVLSAAARGPAPRRRSCAENRTASTPSWSPDGRRFAYSSCVAARCRVYVASAAHPSQPTQIARGEDPVWSPDGRRIAYARRIDSTCAGIWLIYPNGTGARPLLR
jgi:Tol biopolymer transport system component